MNLTTLPAEAPFLPSLAERWLAAAGRDPLAVARGVILLPTRRAARSLADAFLQASGGRPLLLPRIVAFGALDEAPLALAGALELPAAVAPAQRLAVLSRLILALDGRNGAPTAADAAWRLAMALADLMDEAERAEIDLGQRLPDAADAAYAEHWQTTLAFLEIVTAHWPAWLAQQGLMNPAARQVALLRRQATAWQAAPPQEPVWVAGSTAGFPAVAALLATIARLPSGLVVLPGLDRDLPEPIWQGLEPTHPQAGLRRLLLAMNAGREDVHPWPTSRDDARATGRSAALALALLPASSLHLWREQPAPPTRDLVRLQAADEQEEAVAIALVLREALEQPGRRAALVTPDRALARRVTAELARFGVIADDSAGEPLTETPPGVFLRLLAAASESGFAPVELLALLKHPLAALGLSAASCREAARLLERAVLRGQRARHGLGGLRRRLDKTPAAPGRAVVEDLLSRLERALEPLLRATASVVAAPVALLTALIEAAEALATTDEAPGATRLWAGEDGEALAGVLAPALDSLAVLDGQSPRILPGLLDVLMEGAVVRTRRALRGRTGAEHPRLFIWGLIEARLQHVDTIVLGGLVEGVWPPATDPGPWLSRPMRARIGLASPEEAIGQAAHDFVAAACAAQVVVLSGARRRDGAPAVPARWLTRLEACLGPTALGSHPAVAWARALDQPAGAPTPVSPPRPKPPVSARPRRLTVSDVETWLKDPYAIHAKYVLRLRPLDPLDQATEHADFGTLVHAALYRFVVEHGTALPGDTAAALRLLLRKELANAELRKALTAWWQPRLDRIADWLAEQELARRAAMPLVAIAAERSGTWTLTPRGGTFELAGRADRIERRNDGKIALLDYKTGSVPAKSEVKAGRAPQLPLEAAMARMGVFGPEFAAETAELTYLQLTGDRERGKVVAIDADPGALIANAEDGLRGLIDAYDDPARAYLARPVPQAAPRFGNYAQLARLAEWAMLDDAEP